MKTKTVLPGVVLRRWDTGKKSIRFACMIRGKRFTKTCDLPVELLVDPRTGRASAELRAEYNRWVDDCSRSLGRAGRGSMLRAPTIGELRDVYEIVATERSSNPNFRSPSRATISQVLSAISRACEMLGLSMSRPYTELWSTPVLQEFFRQQSEATAGTTAWLYCVRIKEATARWALPKYRERGYAVETCAMPETGSASRPPEYRMLSAETKDAITRWYASLPGESDQQMFLAASMVAQLAMRPCDVAELTAENFVRYPDDPHVHLVYTPRKTRQSSNRRVDWPIRPALWEQIVAIAGSRLAAGRRMLSSRHVFAKLNASMRAACHMEEWNKAVYELRKLCIDTVRREQGVDAAVALSGDRRETIDRYYSDPYKIVGIKPLEILPMPAIEVRSDD